MSTKLEGFVKPGLASDAVYFSKLAELHALKSKESETSVSSSKTETILSLVSAKPETMDALKSKESKPPVASSSKSEKVDPRALSQIVSSGLQSRNPLPANPSPEVVKRLQKLGRGGGMQEAAGNLVPVIPSSQSSSGETEGKTAPKTARAQFFSKNQAKSVDKALMLVTVNVVGSTGPLRFLVDAKDPVTKVIDLALKAYSREGRLPRLGSNSKSFDLFCVNSNFEALDPAKPIVSVGARQFILHRRRSEDEAAIEEQNEQQGASFPWNIWLNLMHSIVCSH